jgi:NADP-dependent 3-hydroxy acid dehydrogenase YdfG
MSSKPAAVWITGAATGIGRSITKEFLNNNLFVIGSSRNKENLNKLKDELNSYHSKFVVEPLDIQEFSSVQSVFNRINKDYEIDCLINNAGITSFSLTTETDINLGDTIIKTNLLGSIYTSQNVLPAMIHRKGGTIINILSVAARKIFTGSSYYSASKAGLRAFMNVLREEVRDKKIRIINVYPGATITPIWPEDTLNKQSTKMMSSDDIANLIYKIYAENSNMVTEEIVIRPVTGDL